MKRRVGGACLGLAIGERSIAVAEVNAGRGGEPTATRAGSFALDDANLSKPQAVGQALKKFLRDNGFSASKAVIGLPARWVMARERQVPPANATAASALLRLQAERQFPPELKDLTYDYAGQTSATKPSTVLLVATARPQMERAIEAARAAGLTPVAVTSTSLALAAALSDGDGANIVLSVGEEATELVVRSADGNPRMLRHLSIAGAQLASGNGTAAVSLASVGGELFRAATLGAAAGRQPELIVWDGVGLRAEALTALGDRAGVKPAQVRDLSRLSVRGAPAGAGEPAKYGSAVALALSGVRPELMPVDFLSPRLAAPKERTVGRKAKWGVGVAVALVAIIGYAAWDLQRQEADLAAQQAEIDQLKPSVKSAEAVSTKVTYAGGWFDARPSALEATKRITQAFPEVGTVWATNLSLRDTGKGTLLGKASNQSDVLAVYDRLKADPGFTEVNLNWREAGGTSRDIAFTINFTFTEGR